MSDGFHYLVGPSKDRNRRLGGCRNVSFFSLALYLHRRNHHLPIHFTPVHWHFLHPLHPSRVRTAHPHAHSEIALSQEPFEDTGLYQPAYCDTVHLFDLFASSSSRHAGKLVEQRQSPDAECKSSGPFLTCRSCSWQKSNKRLDLSGVLPSLNRDFMLSTSLFHLACQHIHSQFQSST